MDSNQFIESWKSFPSKYMKHFNSFWNWRIEVEINGNHILDDAHLDDTYRKLCGVLPKWQTYRPLKFGSEKRQLLRESLESVSKAYSKIKNYSLLEFEKAPKRSLEKIWHKLGQIKTETGKRDSNGYYSIIAVCKPLMLLWGQTMAFDKRVRENIPINSLGSKHKWNFERWVQVMKDFSRKLNKNEKFTRFLKEWCREVFGTDRIVPYGRFLDIFYFTKQNSRKIKPERVKKQEKKLDLEERKETGLNSEKEIIIEEVIDRLPKQIPYHERGIKIGRNLIKATLKVLNEANNHTLPQNCRNASMEQTPDGLDKRVKKKMGTDLRTANIVSDELEKAGVAVVTKVENPHTGRMVKGTTLIKEFTW